MGKKVQSVVQCQPLSISRLLIFFGFVRVYKGNVNRDINP